jgi:hypothetical protein
MNEQLEVALPPFVSKTYRLINDPQVAPYAAWTEDGKAFTVFNPAEFAANVLPKYFKHSNFCSFVRYVWRGSGGWLIFQGFCTHVCARNSLEFIFFVNRRIFLFLAFFV